MTQPSPYKITWFTGMAIVVANMIGTGVFTSLGFQLPDIQNTYAILLLWIIGGICALAGAFSYAEIGTVINKSGGEYIFLSEIYHPVIGYLSGWISITVGFAAPVALAAIAIADYSGHLGMQIEFLSIYIILTVTLIHSFNLKVSSLFQNISTAIKILFILSFICAGIILAPEENNAVSLTASLGEDIFTSGFAIALIFVAYSYTGWNAAAYITEEFRKPRFDLPLALIGGTVLVTIFYTLLQFIFLKHATLEDLIGQVEVGAIAASNMFTESWAAFFSGMIALLLISSISAMVWVGPRVTGKMSEDFRIWSFLKANSTAVPVRAIWFQALISVLLILTGSFEQILIYCGVLLILSSALVVFGVFIVRNKSQYPIRYRSPGYPFWQIIFLVFSVWMIGFAIFAQPREIFWGLTNLFLGLITYYINKNLERRS